MPLRIPWLIHGALADTVVDTRSVSDDQGRSVISFCLSDCLDSLVEVSADRDMSNIYVTVCDGHACEVFLLGLLAGCCELCDSTCSRSLGSLSACVGVNFCIEYHDVDITAGSENMVYTAVSDIICPAVTTEDPLALLSQEVLLCDDFLCIRGIDVSKSCNQCICCCSVLSTLLVCIEPSLAFRCALAAFCDNVLNVSLEAFTDCLLSKEHTVTELSVVLEQGVIPCRALAFRCNSVRCGR